MTYLFGADVMRPFRRNCALFAMFSGWDNFKRQPFGNWVRSFQRHQNYPTNHKLTPSTPIWCQNKENTKKLNFPLSMIKLCCEVFWINDFHMKLFVHDLRTCINCGLQYMSLSMLKTNKRNVIDIAPVPQ